jgi:diguanylate cyclase (GGDEF)-like protein
VVKPGGVANEALWSAEIEPDRRIRVTRVLHAHEDRFVGHYVDELLPGDATATLLGVADTGVPIEFETRFCGAVGEHLFSIHAFSEGDGRRLSGVIRNVTTERARLTHLGERDELNRGVLDAIPAPTAVIDAKGVIQLINAAWLHEATDLEHEVPLPGDSLFDAFGNSPHVVEGIRAVLDGRDDHYDVDLSDGTAWWNVRVAPFSLRGEPAAVIVHTDITERITQQRVIEALSERRRSAARQMYEQRGLLELIASGAALETVSREVIAVGERALPGSRWMVFTETPGAWSDKILIVGAEESDRLAIEEDYRTFSPARWDDPTNVVLIPSTWPATTPEQLAFAGSLAAPILTDRNLVIGYLIVRPSAEEDDPEARALIGQFASIVRLAVERDATTRRDAERLLEDPLTGLPSHTLFHRRLEQAISRIGTYARSVAVICLDLDRFGRINETLGHNAGDAVLVEMAERLRHSRPALDTVARAGGDEFVVLIEDVAHEDVALRIAGELLDALSQPIDLDGVEFVCPASAGVAVVADRSREAGSVESDANLAMAAAKSHGRNRVERYTTDLRSERPALTVERELHRATIDGQVIVHFQPEISLDTNTIVGVEALVRWDHPQHGLLLPVDFVAVAEESGAIVEIGREVIRQACSRVAEWGEMLDSALTVSINLSARQLEDPGLIAFVTTTLERFGVSPARLRFEVTERTLMAHGDRGVETFHALRDLGVHVTIDDFGTGYSSLLYLKQFPADALKIDRSFVDGLGEDSGDSAIVAAVISLAHQLDLTVIAEGVERPEQVSYLRRLGCEEAQGFLWGEPMSADSMTAVLERPLPMIPESSTPEIEVGSNGRELDEILAVLTHELATPLTIIGGYAEMLADRLDTDELSDASARNGMEAIERNVQSLGQLVASLADARDNVRPIEHFRLDIASLLDELREELEPAFEGREVTWELPTTPLVVEGDPAGLRQVAVNLLDNALKFSPNGSPVSVVAGGGDGNVTVRIIDHGPGVPTQRTSELFGRFARLGSTRRGLGLGLYLARAIARRHCGDVTYEPTAGGGATFVLTVPCNAGAEGT